MKEKIIEILGVCIYPELAELQADQILKLFKEQKAMKITKDTQTVWKLENGNTIVGTERRFDWDGYFVRVNVGIVEYTKDDMIKIYGLTEDQFDNIEKSGI